MQLIVPSCTKNTYGKEQGEFLVEARTSEFYEDTKYQ